MSTPGVYFSLPRDQDHSIYRRSCSLRHFRLFLTRKSELPFRQHSSEDNVHVQQNHHKLRVDLCRNWCTLQSNGKICKTINRKRCFTLIFGTYCQRHFGPGFLDQPGLISASHPIFVFRSSWTLNHAPAKLGPCDRATNHRRPAECMRKDVALVAGAGEPCKPCMHDASLCVQLTFTAATSASVNEVV